MYSVCFTGHRNIKITDELKITLVEKLCRLIETNDITDFYAGGAVGWDTICAYTVIGLRSVYPQIRLHLVLPCCEADQTAKWSNLQKAAYKEISAAADSIEYISQNYYDGCMKKRNERLVELSDICICYYNSNKRTGGTAQTVRMAMRKNMRIINLYTYKN